MHHLIFGSGLIGSYLGSVMTLNGASVAYVARGVWKQRLSQTLQLTDYLGNNGFPAWLLPEYLQAHSPRYPGSVAASPTAPLRYCQKTWHAKVDAIRCSREP